MAVTPYMAMGTMVCCRSAVGGWTQRFGGSRKLQELRRTLHAGRRDGVMQDAQLREHRGLIPIEALTGYLAGSKLNDARQGDFDFPARRRHIRKHPVHIERVREADHEFLDDSIVAEGLRQGTKFEIGRDARQELLRI